MMANERHRGLHVFGRVAQSDRPGRPIEMESHFRTDRRGFGGILPSMRVQGDVEVLGDRISKKYGTYEMDWTPSHGFGVIVTRPRMRTSSDGIETTRSTDLSAIVPTPNSSQIRIFLVDLQEAARTNPEVRTYVETNRELQDQGVKL